MDFNLEFKLKSELFGFQFKIQIEINTFGFQIEIQIELKTILVSIPNSNLYYLLCLIWYRFRVRMACKNIFRLSSKDDDQGQKEISKYIKHSQLEIATDQEILDSWSRMESKASSCNKAQLKTWSQAAGIDWSEKALLASPTLRKQNLLQPISQMILCMGWLPMVC